MKIRSILASGAVVLMAVGTGVAGASSAVATPVRAATGHVALANPSQYVNFAALAAPSRYHGSIDYANFTYALPGTHVWSLGGPTLPVKHPLVFKVGSDTYAHTMTVDTVTATSTHSTQFSGTGTYDKDPTHYTWTVSGAVNWNAVSFTIVYTGADKGYTLKAHGYIAPNGSVFGTATDIRGNTLKFAMGKGSAFEVLRYTAPVAWAFVYPHGNAKFGYTIPKWLPKGLAGLHIIVKVHDGGYGFTHDAFGFGVAKSKFDGPVTYYKIISGNILVRR